MVFLSVLQVKSFINVDCPFCPSRTGITSCVDPQNAAASAAQLGQVQIGGGGRERAGAGADPRRDAAHAAV